RRHQFAAVRKINSIDARVPVRRATDEHVHGPGAGFLEIVHARLAGGAAHDRIVHNDDPFVFHELGDQVQLNADVEVADKLSRLQKTAADVMIAHEGHLERDVRLLRVTEGGAVAAVGHGHDDVGGDRMFAREVTAHFHADFIHVAVGYGAVGPGQIDVC